MNIAVVHGQQHRGSTYHCTHMVLDRLAERKGELRVSEFFLPGDGPAPCIGCGRCFTEGEDRCPHAAKVQPIARALADADLIIFDSPCYVFGMTGQLKTLMDHLGYRWMSHRPHPAMFRKTGLAISTAAGAGTSKVTKALKTNLFYWGVPRIYRWGANVAAVNWESVKPGKKEELERHAARLADRIARRKPGRRPSLKTRLMFAIMRLNQKRNDWNPRDLGHWQERGWMEKGRPW